MNILLLLPGWLIGCLIVGYMRDTGMLLELVRALDVVAFSVLAALWTKSTN